MSIDILSGPEIHPKEPFQAENMVILLHGLGSNGDDLISLADHWKHFMPNTVFLSPNAPFPCDMAPVGYQWFSLQSHDFAFVRSGVETAAPYLETYIQAKLKEFNLTDDKLAIVGFSQGTMMSLFHMPRREKSCAAILGYSGATIDDASLMKEAKHKPPVFLVHGMQDDVVPFQALEGTKSCLETCGFEVETLARPNLGHSIDLDGLELGGRFLVQKLYRNGFKRSKSC